MPNAKNRLKKECPNAKGKNRIEMRTEQGAYDDDDNDHDNNLLDPPSEDENEEDEDED